MEQGVNNTGNDISGAEAKNAAGIDLIDIVSNFQILSEITGDSSANND